MVSAPERRELEAGRGRARPLSFFPPLLPAALPSRQKARHALDCARGHSFHRSYRRGLLAGYAGIAPRRGGGQLARFYCAAWDRRTLAGLLPLSTQGRATASAARSWAAIRFQRSAE